MTGGPIEDYLARLRAGLRTPSARTAEIVAEAEDHLRESAAARRAAGLGEEAAERAAVTAFGPVRQVTRAHRPTLAAYAASAGMRAWPLLGCYLLLSALLGGVLTWREISAFHGIMTLVTRHGTTFLVATGRPDAVQLAATLGGCALAGLAVIAGFLLLRRRLRYGAAPVPLPPGLFPLAAGIVLLGFAIGQARGARGHGYGWLAHISGLYELAAGGGLAAAALLGACCVLRALVTMAEAAVRPPERAVAGLDALPSGPPIAGVTVLDGRTGSAQRPAVAASGPVRLAVRDSADRAAAYCAEASLKVGQWLGSFLLLSALIAGVLLYVENQGAWSEPRFLAVWEAGCAGGGLAGALLFALVIRARRGREASRARVTTSRWPAQPATAALLVVIAVAEYWIIADNANGRLATAELAHRAWQGLYWVVVGAQFAAMLMGAGTVVRWVLAGWRAAEGGGRGQTAAPHSPE